MVLKLLEVGADTSLANEANRTPFAEAEEFDKFEIAVLPHIVRKYWHLSPRPTSANSKKTYKC